jgi:hypothetical protein
MLSQFRSTGTDFLRTALIALALVVAGAMPALAQEVRAPIDPDSSLYVLDAELEQTLDLFPEIDGFQQAVLYQQSDGSFELVIEYREGAQTLRERRELTAGDVADLRARVGERLQATGTRVGLNQEGRSDLLTATTLLGVVEGSLLAGVLAGEDDGSLIASLPLLGGSLGFFVPLLATRNAPVSEGSAALTGYGGLQGYAHAVQLAGLVAGEDADGRATAGLAAALGAAEAVAGHEIGRRRGWSGGTAEMIAYTGTYGNLIGLGLGVVAAGSSDDDVASSLDSDDRLRIASGLSLLGSFGGMWAGHRLARAQRYTEGDARIYLNAGLVGIQLGGSILAATDSPSESPRLAVGLLTASALGGLGAGVQLLRDRDFTKTEGNIIALGAYSGGLLGSGVAALADTEGDTAFILSSIGTALGFGISYGVFAGGAQNRAASFSSLDVRVAPTLTRPSARFAEGDGSLRPGLTLRASF